MKLSKFQNENFQEEHEIEVNQQLKNIMKKPIDSILNQKRRENTFNKIKNLYQQYDTEQNQFFDYIFNKDKIRNPDPRNNLNYQFVNKPIDQIFRYSSHSHIINFNYQISNTKLTKIINSEKLVRRKSHTPLKIELSITSNSLSHTEFKYDENEFEKFKTCNQNLQGILHPQRKIRIIDRFYNKSRMILYNNQMASMLPVGHRKSQAFLGFSNNLISKISIFETVIEDFIDLSSIIKVDLESKLDLSGFNSQNKSKSIIKLLNDKKVKSSRKSLRNLIHTIIQYLKNNEDLSINELLSDVDMKKEFINTQNKLNFVKLQIKKMLLAKYIFQRDQLFQKYNFEKIQYIKLTHNIDILLMNFRKQMSIQIVEHYDMVLKQTHLILSNFEHEMSEIFKTVFKDFREKTDQMKKNKFIETMASSYDLRKSNQKLSQFSKDLNHNNDFIAEHSNSHDRVVLNKILHGIDEAKNKAYYNQSKSFYQTPIRTFAKSTIRIELSSIDESISRSILNQSKNSLIIDSAKNQQGYKSPGFDSSNVNPSRTRNLNNHAEDSLQRKKMDDNNIKEKIKNIRFRNRSVDCLKKNFKNVQQLQGKKIIF